MDSNDHCDKEEKSYEAMYQSFTKRAPNKRKVKPVESQLVQFAFGGLDSDEDDDYTLPENFDGGESGEESGSDSSESIDSEEDQDDKIVLEDILNLQKKQQTNNLSPKPQTNTVLVRNENRLFCGVCLECESTEEDEILQCDLCSVSVHEGCYGKCKENAEKDVETDSTDSDSTASTVPWFCDACKADNLTPSCELCPSLGGIYKQCNTGHWVHLICALYTPEVRIEDDEALDYICLGDVPSSHWGAKPCSFCEDPKLCQTGITIGCDAGLCRTYFHVTCAQREGLLSDLPNAEVCLHDQADPLFAHCRLHAEKIAMKKKKNCWQLFNKGVHSHARKEDVLKERVKTALTNARREYNNTRKPLAPSQDMPSFSARMLTTCPETCRQLIQKSDLLGYSIQSQFAGANQKGIRSSQPNLTVDFIKHFYDREVKLKDMSNITMTQGEESVLLLQQRERNMRNDLERLKKRSENEKEVQEYLKTDVHRFHSYINSLCGVQLPMPVFNKNVVSHLSTVGDTKCVVEDLVKEIEKECFTCKSKEDSHKLVECDTCHNYYHFTCVDPPLKRMPKKSKAFLWQCTDCDSSESDSSERSSQEDADSGDGRVKSVRKKRRPRQVTKPEKFTPDLPPVKRRKLSTGKPQRRKLPQDTESTSKANNSIQMTPSQIKNGEATPKSRKRIKEIIIAICSICEKESSSIELVKCAECQRCFHFKTCLDPPYKSTPQKRGYSWHCTDCDDTPSDDTDNDDNDNEKAVDNK